MTVAAVALMAAGLVLFVVGFRFHPDSRARARLNVATILCVYFGVVLAFTAQIHRE